MDEYEAHVELGRCPSEPGARGCAEAGRTRERTELVTLTIDGKEVTVPTGTLIIRAAEQLGIEIPRFCDHPLLEPVGACRQCYVEIEGQRKLFTSCTTTVAPGMVVMTQNTVRQATTPRWRTWSSCCSTTRSTARSATAGASARCRIRRSRSGRGRAATSRRSGRTRSRCALSPLVGLDRERCVLCARCTRFCDQISGDRFIELFDSRRGRAGVDRAGRGLPLALQREHGPDLPGRRADRDAVPVRGAAVRPVDRSTRSARTAARAATSSVDMRRGEVVRQLARDNLEVNDAWLCDKGRFAFRFPDAPDRVTTPLIRDHGLEPASFGEVLDRDRRRGATRQARRVPHRRAPDGRGLLRALEARAHRLRDERPGSPARRRRRGSPRSDRRARRARQP